MAVPAEVLDRERRKNVRHGKSLEASRPPVTRPLAAVGADRNDQLAGRAALTWAYLSEAEATG